jgi:hypothetical protein
LQFDLKLYFSHAPPFVLNFLTINLIYLVAELLCDKCDSHHTKEAFLVISSAAKLLFNSPLFAFEFQHTVYVQNGKYPSL